MLEGWILSARGVETNARRVDTVPEGWILSVRGVDVSEGWILHKCQRGGYYSSVRGVDTTQVSEGWILLKCQRGGY